MTATVIDFIPRSTTAQERNRARIKSRRAECRWRPELCWVANIQLDGKMKNLGHFATKEEAGAKYDAVARAHYGNYFHSELLMDHVDTGDYSPSEYSAPLDDPA